MTTHTPTPWGVNIQGPDDMLAAADYETAVKIANAFNDWWARHIHVRRRDEYDPRMWAVPVEWNGDAASHAKYLANPSPDYRGFIDYASTLDRSHDALLSLAKAVATHFEGTDAPLAGHARTVIRAAEAGDA